MKGEVHLEGMVTDVGEHHQLALDRDVGQVARHLQVRHEERTLCSNQPIAICRPATPLRMPGWLCWPFGISVRLKRRFDLAHGSATPRQGANHKWHPVTAWNRWGAPDADAPVPPVRLSRALPRPGVPAKPDRRDETRRPGRRGGHAPRSRVQLVDLNQGSKSLGAGNKWVTAVPLRKKGHRCPSWPGRGGADATSAAPSVVTIDEEDYGATTGRAIPLRRSHHRERHLRRGPGSRPIGPPGPLEQGQWGRRGCLTR